MADKSLLPGVGWQWPQGPPPELLPPQLPEAGGVSI